MKKIFRYSLILASFVSLFLSCNPDDNNNDPQPVDDPRDKFVGTWHCSENSHQNGASNFIVTASLNSGNSSQIYLANFYQLGTGQKVYGVVANTNVTVPSQTVSGVTINGSGNMTDNNTKISWNYYVNDGADIDTCTAVFSK